VREGSSIGPYRIVRKIGEGGMGTVYLGEHTLIGRRAAIKVLLPELSSRRDSVDRFFNEARATTAISDPGIVQVFDFGFTPDRVAYIVMELLEGEQLNARLRRLRALTPADALRITRQTAGSLGAAHAAGIVHRDLKPENLFMIRDPEALGGERPKILDFGIAKLGDEVPDRVKTQTGAVLGTPVYMSPEQCHGAGRVDHRADIYALGCVLCHLLTGRPPFDLSGVGAIISAHLREPPPRPSSRIIQLPPEIDELVLRCLAKSPDERFATMLELQQACDAILVLVSRGSARNHSMPSGSMPMPMAIPTPVLTSSTPPDASRTTLSTSSGQSLGGIPRRRLGLWIAAAALAGGAGSTVAVLISRPGARGVREPAAQAATAPAAANGEAVDAAAPVVAAPAPPPPTASATPQPPAGPAASPGTQTGAPVDAGAEAAAVVPAMRAEPAAALPSPAPRTEPVRPPAPAATRKPGSARPTAASKPKPRPNNDDLYDDRN
jgi:eukaryotic-like serine/threonine-protein kinase